MIVEGPVTAKGPVINELGAGETPVILTGGRGDRFRTQLGPQLRPQIGQNRSQKRS